MSFALDNLYAIFVTPIITNEKNQTRINYFTKDDEFDYTSASSSDLERIDIEEELRWVSFKQQFFSSAVISENYIVNSSLISEYQESDLFNKKFTLNSEIPFVNNTITLKYYFGPNKYSILKDIDYEFHNNLYLGWFGVGGFNRYIIVPIFNFLENITSNYGLIILFMVFLIRIVVTPLTFKSHLSMAKMKVLNPEIQDIRKKHDGDMQKSQGEIMELYQKTGVSPLGGCLPILFQLPILVSVFYFLPNAIELTNNSQHFSGGSDILFIGRNEKRKNYQLYEQLSSVAKNKKYNFRAITNQNIHSENISVFVNPDNGIKEGLLKKSSIYLAVNTHGESFGITIVEAINSGCIAICSDIQPFKELLEDSGVYFKNNDLDSLTLAVENITSKDVTNIYLKQLKHIRKYDIDKVITSWISLYSQI